MTRRAVRAKLPAMPVQMTGNTFSLEAEVRLGLVTLITLQGAMLAFQAVTGLGVIEGRQRRRPAHQLEVPAGMFAVATNTVDITLRPIGDPSVITPVVLNPLCDLHMTT